MISSVTVTAVGVLGQRNACSVLTSYTMLTIFVLINVVIGMACLILVIIHVWYAIQNVSIRVLDP